jgi:hypothetical protein
VNFKDDIMQSQHFDLNDIQQEPSDEQLRVLMNAVVIEANRRAELARVALMQRLREDIVIANRSRTAA